MAAISVDGRCRERNPPDMAIFGADGDRLTARFVNTAEGQAMLARCTGEGTAEGTALLMTTGGPQRFRISLWRQRGGERIRILGAFATSAPPGGAETVPATSAAAPAPRTLLAEGLGTPVEAVLAIAARLRAALRGEADEARAGLGLGLAALLGAGWRLRRLADDLREIDEMRTTRLPVRLAEVDSGRLVRRVIEVIEAAETADGITLATDLPPAGPLVMSDEAALWSLIELMLCTAAGAAREAGGEGLSVSAPQTPSGAAILISAHGGPAPPETRIGPHPALRARIEMLSEAAGARVDLAPEGGLAALRFGPGRCLDPA